MPEYQTIVMRHALPEAIMAARSVLEREVLPSYLAKRRWFAMKDQALRSARIALMSRRAARTMRSCLRSRPRPHPASARWLLPLGIVWDDANAPPLPAQLALARVRAGPKVGLLTDAFALPAFAHRRADGPGAGRDPRDRQAA